MNLEMLEYGRLDVDLPESLLPSLALVCSRAKAYKKLVEQFFNRVITFIANSG